MVKRKVRYCFTAMSEDQQKIDDSTLAIIVIVCSEGYKITVEKDCFKIPFPVYEGYIDLIYSEEKHSKYFELSVENKEGEGEERFYVIKPLTNLTTHIYNYDIVED